MSVTYKELPAIPELMTEYKSAAKDLIPGIGTTRSAKNDPSTGFEVKGVKVNIAHLGAYCAATGLRLGNELPATYLYVLSFPLVMKVMTTPDYPFNAVGGVHLTNIIEQSRPLTVDDEFTIRVHAQNLRPHRKGLLIDMVTEVFVDNDPAGSTAPVWTQTSGFLAKGAKLSSSVDAAVKARPVDSGSLFTRPELPADPTPSTTLTATKESIKVYAEASGDKNPIHVSSLGAKAFGFPSTIAHGMWSAAVILASLEGELPVGGSRFSIEFAKPVTLPAKVAEFTSKDSSGSWDVQLRKASKLETLHAIARVEAL